MHGAIPAIPNLLIKKFQTNVQVIECQQQALYDPLIEILALKKELNKPKREAQTMQRQKIIIWQQMMNGDFPKMSK